MKPKHKLWTDIEQEWEAAWLETHPHELGPPEGDTIPIEDKTKPSTLKQQFDLYFGTFYEACKVPLEKNPAYCPIYGVSLEDVKKRVKRHKTLIESGACLKEFADLLNRAIGIPDVKRRDIDILDYSLVHVAGAQLAFESQHVALGRIHMAAAMHFLGMFSNVLYERTEQNASHEIYHNDDARDVVSAHDPNISIKTHLGKLLYTRRPNGGWKTEEDVAARLHEEMIAFVKDEIAKGRLKKKISTDEIDMTETITKWIKRHEMIWRAYKSNSSSE